MNVIHLYREPGLSEGTIKRKIKELQSISRLVAGLNTEFCFNIEVHGILSESEKEKLHWILASPFNPSKLQNKPFLQGENLGSLLIEIGPRLNFSTPFSSNAVSICHYIGLTKIKRLELSTRYLIHWQMNGLKISNALEQQLTDALHDRMTQCRYREAINSFDHGITPEPWYVVDVLGQGRKALEDVNSKLGLAFDNWDLDYYTQLFSEKLKRNPTSVECFDLAQSNSEHSRHWFFKGRLVVNKKEKRESLFDMIISTQKTSNPNNVIKFSDNSSAIEGFKVTTLRPTAVDKASSLFTYNGKYHIVFTAETHNFPTGVAPFSGATTGTGGRIRDVQAVGRGGHCIAGTAGYSVGNLYIPDYHQPWEDINLPYPSNLASPLEILIEASNGASDYGNKFGEPVVCGFTRSFGLTDSSGERREWIKPIMFSGGIGVMNEEFVNKLKPEKGMEVVKVGGPVYRIGVGGGSASSVQVQGDNSSELDFGAVQRGDAEMGQKLNRVIRACMEHSDGNPICSIHDQGAGGNGNVLKELVEPSGAVIFTNNFILGDPSVSTLELWGAEYQENNALLCHSKDKPLLKNIAHRERCPVNFVGSVTGNGKVILSEESVPEPAKYIDGNYVLEDRSYPFDLDLELVLGKMPQKVFHLDRKPVILRTFHLPTNLTVMSALERVLRLPTVCSKRFLTNKVDRCVTGLVAQQQCVGPLHTPLSDVAVTAISMFSTEGMATAIGEQPIKGLNHPAAGARMTVGEALSNLVFAKISDIKDIKCSGNWMWAAKLPGEGYALYEACTAMCNIMSELGVAVDGGKDSLSMAAKVDSEVVKAPGTLVVSAYAPCPDIRKVVTPDLKAPSTGKCGSLFLVDLSRSNNRLGGSALLQCFSQLGDRPPDMDDPNMFLNAFKTTQKLIDEDKILAGHDISDGGLITCLLEMAFGGISGFRVNLEARMRGVANLLKPLFAEELGWILEVRECDTGYIEKCFCDAQVTILYIGKSQGYGIESKVNVRCGDAILLDNTLLPLFRMWEETSYRLEKRQANPTCVEQEFELLSKRTGPKYKLTFSLNSPPPSLSKSISLAPKVAVIREEGTNGDREMASSLYMAHFEVWDVTVQDLLDKKISVDYFKGIVFPGGFSYADVLGSGKGWAASLLFHPELRSQFKAFASQPDTFSLGVCNGCQLMSLLGWVGTSGLGVDIHTPPDVALDHNSSDRYECRFSTVQIEKSSAIMFKGMEGSVLGVWVAHSEGKFCFREPAIQTELEKKNCLPLKYVDDNGSPTEEYPMNPNGSPGGIAGICSEDGRHLALMPHPERCTVMWQWPYLPPGWEKHTESPWLWMFYNAFEWCINN